MVDKREFALLCNKKIQIDFSHRKMHNESFSPTIALHCTTHLSCNGCNSPPAEFFFYSCCWNIPMRIFVSEQDCNCRGWDKRTRPLPLRRLLSCGISPSSPLQMVIRYNGQVLCNGATHCALCQHHFSTRTGPKTILAIIKCPAICFSIFFEWPVHWGSIQWYPIIEMGFNANLFVLLTARRGSFCPGDR